MPGPRATTVFTKTLVSPIIAFVVATEAPAASQDDDFFFGALEGLQDDERLEELPDYELVEEVIAEIKQIKDNSGVGSPEVRKYIDAWSPPVSHLDSKDAHLRVLAENLYQRRPVLYLKGHSRPYPAQVLLRTVRKPAVGALSAAGGPAGLFKNPSNSFIVIKFDPQFGYADIIVDPFFTDAFIQQPSTATYGKLLSELPRTFVGTAPELRRTVALLTQQSIRACAAKAATCPPWRRFDAMLARWLPKKFTDEIIAHGPGGMLNFTVNTAAAPVLLRSDSASSRCSADSSFSLNSSSAEVGSSSSAGSSLPRTIVHGFEIPAAKAPAVPAMTAAESVAVPAAVSEVAAPAAVCDVAAPAELADAAIVHQQYDSLGGAIAAKLSAAAITDDHSADPASSWQLAAGMVAVDDVQDAVYSSSTGSNASAHAASYNSQVNHRVFANRTFTLGLFALPVADATAEAEPAAGPPLAMLQEQLLRHDGSTAAAAAPTGKDPSDQLLAAAGYSTRSVKLMGPTAAAAAEGADGRLCRHPSSSLHPTSRTPTPGLRHDRVCCGHLGWKGHAACVDVEANSRSADTGMGDAAGRRNTALGRVVYEGQYDQGPPGGGQYDREGPPAVKFAEAVATIQESVVHYSAVPAIGPPATSSKVIGGRKVVRLDYAGAVVCRAV